MVHNYIIKRVIISSYSHAVQKLFVTKYRPIVDIPHRAITLITEGYRPFPTVPLNTVADITEPILCSE